MATEVPTDSSPHPVDQASRPAQNSTGDAARLNTDVEQDINTVGPGATVVGVQYGYTAKEVAALLATAGRTESDLTALHQLPDPPPNFTDRVAELTALLNHVADGSTTLIGLRGAGGVGKTALALKLAQQLTQRFPDAQFYLDMHGTDNQPLAPADALSRIIRAYTPLVRLPENVPELRALFNSLLRNKRTLSLLANVRDAEQINQLIPPTGNILILTSQQHFYMAGMAEQDLDALGASEARDLLLAIAPRIGDQADPIAEMCGYLPLALTLAGSWVREHPSLSPADYLRRCQNVQALLKLTGTDTALRVSYDLLDAASQAAWRALAVFPHTFDAAGPAAIWDCDNDTAGDRLATLLQNSMVGWNPAVERYHLHNLARVFATAQWDSAESIVTGRRHAIRYEQVLRNAELLYRQGKESLQQGLTMFDREWSNIQAAHEWARNHAVDDSTAVGLCNTFPQAGRLLLDLRLSLRDLIQWLDAGLSAAQALGNRPAEARHLNDLAVAYSDLGDARRSNQYAGQALEIARKAGDRNNEGVALSYLGSNYTDLGEPRRAIGCIEHALKIDQELKDWSGESTDQRYMGDALAQLGQTSEAIALYDQALAIARELNDEEDIARNLSCLGCAYVALDEPLRAITYCNEAIQIEQAIGDRFNEGRNSDTLGLAHAALGDYQQALACHQRAQGLARDSEDRHGEASALLHLGVAQAALGDLPQAMALFDEALRRAQETGDRPVEAHTRWQMSLAQKKLGDHARAIAQAEAALVLLTAMEDPLTEAARRQLAQWQQGDAVTDHTP